MNINEIKKIHINADNLKPFDNKILDLLTQLSSLMIKKNETQTNPEFMSFAFWIRKKNLDKLKEKYSKNTLKNKLGLGVLFHVPPSNIMSSFAYSMIFGLLSGNVNIIRLPKKSEDLAKLIIKCLNKIKIKELNLSRYIYFIENYVDDNFSNYISGISDGRLIWGGDKTVNLFKKLNTKKKCVNLYFDDKYSLSIINSEKLCLSNKLEIDHLVRNFYNDTYLVDQNACSSPNLIVWTGNKIEKAKKIFWTCLYKYVKNKYKLSFFSAVDKFTSTIVFSSQSVTTPIINNKENLLVRIKLNKLDQNLENFRGKWGLFYEYNNNKKYTIKLPISKKYQTITSYGYSKKQIDKLKENSNLSSVSRIVPIGLAMELDLFWDGYDIINMLTKNCNGT